MRQQCAWQSKSERSHQAGGLGWAKVVMRLDDLRSRSPANTATTLGQCAATSRQTPMAKQYSPVSFEGEGARQFDARSGRYKTACRLEDGLKSAAGYRDVRI